MISAVLILNSTGDVLISKIYREDVKNEISSIFYDKIIKNERFLKNPFLTIGSTTFIHIREGDLYYVVISRHNADSSVILQFLLNLTKLINHLLNTNVTGKEEYHLKDVDIKNNFLLIYGLLNQLIDQGYVRNIGTESINMLLELFPVKDVSEEDKISNDFNITKESYHLNIINKPETITENHELRINEFVKLKKHNDYSQVDIVGELLLLSKPNNSIDFEFQIPQDTNTLELLRLSSNCTIRSKTRDTLKILYVSENDIESVLNYKSNSSYRNLPVHIDGKYKQLSNDKFEITLLINSNIDINQFNIEMDVPNDTEILKCDNGMVTHADNILIWEKNLKKGKTSINIIIKSKSSVKLSSWISREKKLRVFFDTINDTITKCSVISFNDDNACKVKSIYSFFDYDLTI